MRHMKVFLEVTMLVRLPCARYCMQGFGLPLSSWTLKTTANVATYVNVWESPAAEMRSHCSCDYT
jgi:hypothetical protein